MATNKKSADDFLSTPPAKSADAFLEGPSQPQQQTTTFGMAKQAIGETLREPVPYIGKATEALRRDVPDYLYQKGQQLGVPGIGAAAATAVGTVGELLPKTGGELALTAAGMRPATALYGKATGAVMPKITSFLTGIDSPIVRNAIDRTSQVVGKLKDVAHADIGENIASGIKDTVKASRRAIGQMLGNVEDQVASKYTNRIIPTNGIGQRLEQSFAKAGYDVSGQTGDITRGLSSSTQEILGDFKNLSAPTKQVVSPIVGPQGQQIISQQAAPGVPRQMNFKDALSLRRKIDDAVDWIEQGSMKVGKQEEAILKQARRELNDRLLQVDPIFKKANDAAANVFQKYRELSTNVLSGKKETVMRRISNMFRKGTLEANTAEQMDSIGQAAHTQLQELVDYITASSFAPKIHPGAARAFGHTGGGPFTRAASLGAAVGLGQTHMASGALEGALAAGVATSPRLHLGVIQAGKALGEVAQASPVLGPMLVAPAAKDAFQTHYNRFKNNRYVPKNR